MIELLLMKLTVLVNGDMILGQIIYLFEILLRH
nr:MAG TPA: hypothetical protein [Inoviridae sp.]